MTKDEPLLYAGHLRVFLRQRADAKDQVTRTPADWARRGVVRRVGGGGDVVCEMED
jgi:hypothetical protein